MSYFKMDIYTLRLRQALPLAEKIKLSTARIEQWLNEYGEDGVYVSFSGGKDSTVLLDLVRSIAPSVPGVFVDTGLEYPEIRQFVKSKDNIILLRPKMSFQEVLNKYGYPIISKEVSECVDQARKALTTGKYPYRLAKLMGTAVDKNGNPSKYNQKKWRFLLDAPFKISNQCCNVMKKTPAHRFYRETGRVPIVGTMAEESRLRTQQYLKQGCNGFNNKIPTSMPLAFWTEQDILQYIYENNIPYASVYGDIYKDFDGKYRTSGCSRTGCMFCGYGCHLEKNPNRFQQLAITHPKQYDYIINQLGFGEVLDYIHVAY